MQGKIPNTADSSWVHYTTFEENKEYTWNISGLFSYTNKTMDETV